MTTINTAVRTECLETLLNPAEMSGFSDLCKLLGVSKSAYNRTLINTAVRTHGTGRDQQKESRGCRGPGRPASRASGNVRRNL